MQRFIPAGAGNGGAPMVTAIAAGSSPRARGTGSTFVISEIRHTGSSPRARGTAPRSAGQRWGGRFIPAGAGNGSASGCAAWAAVHPRGRGERNPPERSRRCDQRFIPAGAGNGRAVGGSAGAGPGSSPRARGTDQPRLAWRRATAVHPRGRGERSMHDFQRRGEGRFIPAGAGNGVHVASRSMARTVHPRGRGERRAFGAAAEQCAVHPRGRGERRADLAQQARICRFIPAGAGNGRPVASRRFSFSVHPRGRGERPG